MRLGRSIKLAIARSAWDPEKMANQHDDIRMKMLCYAILAPNPYNKQPWLVELSGEDAITLYIDRERLLPMTDPLHRLIHIGQGTFLEVLSIAAKEFGYNPNVQLFPEGIDSMEETGASPIAVVRLLRTVVEKDGLFRQIPERFTNRRPYTGPPLTTDELRSLQNSYDATDYPTVFITEPEKMNRIANLMTEAMKVDLYVERTHAEMIKMIRFNDDEIAARRDGFSYENMGVTGISRLFAERFAGRDKAFSDSFKKRTLSATHESTHTARAFGIMFSPGNSRIDQVEVGRRFARVHLMATKLGLSMNPSTQMLQEYDELAGVRETLSKIIKSIKPNSELPTAEILSGVTTAQMAFRLGRAKPTPHSPRRELVDFLKSQEANRGSDY